MNKNHYSRISIFFLFIHPLAFAQEKLPEIVITATRSAQTIENSLASVTVLDRNAIEQSQALTLPEILNSVTGLNITNNGGLGKTTSIFMRGTESDHVLVLVDGVKIGSASAGGAPFQDLPLSHIERIEIVRGPRSSLYGSEAIGGVIAIFTRKINTPVQAQVSAGSDNTYEISSGTSMAGKNSAISLNVSRLKTQGFNTCEGNLNGGCFTIEPDDDGYENTALSARMNHYFSKNVRFQTHILHTQGSNEFDSSWNNQSDFLQQVMGFKTDIHFNDRWLAQFNLGNNRDEIESFGNTSPTYINNRRQLFSWQNDFSLSPQEKVIFGYDYQQDKVDSSFNFIENDRDNQGIFTHYNIEKDKTDFNVGFRHDDNAQFGKHSTGNIAAGYDFTPHLRGFLSYGTAFKAPVFNELYFPNFGNPHLQPEKSKSVEIGLTNTQTTYQWSMNAYRTEIDQLIGLFPVENIDKATIIGVESGVQWQLGNWHIKTAFSWLHTEDDATGKKLPRRAENSMSLDITKHFQKTHITAHFLTQSDRFDDRENTQPLSGYGLLDLRGEYTLNKQWTMRASLNNVLDRDYHTARFYDTAGRTLFISIAYQK
jgi:vitamin B12 transporter